MSTVFEGEELFLVEGTLTDVLHSRTTMNLLAQVEKHVKAQSLAAGAAAALNSMPGLLANSAMVALYDGEDMFNFAGLLGEQVICGCFKQGDAFADGDRIKAVVSKRGDVLYTHALLRQNDKMLFMPLSIISGKRAHFRYCMRVAWGFCWFGWIFFGLANYFTQGHVLGYLFILAFMPLIMFPMELWTYRSTRYMGYRASAIFTVLGFPKPDDLNLTRALNLHLGGNTHGVDGAFDYERALNLPSQR